MPNAKYLAYLVHQTQKRSFIRCAKCVKLLQHTTVSLQFWHDTDKQWHMVYYFFIHLSLSSQLKYHFHLLLQPHIHRLHLHSLILFLLPSSLLLYSLPILRDPPQIHRFPQTKYIAIDASLEFECSVLVKELHIGVVSYVDVKGGGVECVTVGKDGRVNLVGVTGSGLSCCRVFDSDGLVSYIVAKWALPVEFGIGGYGFSLRWWVLTTASGWWIWWLKVVLGDVSLKFGFFLWVFAAICSICGFFFCCNLG